MIATKDTSHMASTAEKPRRNRFLSLIVENGLVVALVVIIGIFGLLRPTTFLSVGNFGSILQANSSIAFIALGLMIPLIAGNFDLSVAAVAAFCGIFAAGLMARQNLPMVVAILIVLMVAVAVGLVNGFFVAYMKLHSLVVTLATMSILFGLVLLYTRGAVIFEGIPPEFLNIGQGRPFGIPIPFMIVIVAAIMLWFVLYYRPIGRRLYAIGGSQDAARLIGINVDRTVLMTYVVGSLFAAIGGLLHIASVGAAAPTDGSEYLLPAIAACFLGETSIRRGFYNVWGTVIAVFLVSVGTTGLFMLGAESWIQPVFNGVVLLGAVILAKINVNSRSKRATNIELSVAPSEGKVDDSSHVR
jgi:ribose transport system permease protein